jgi:hypothetical protein
VRHGRASRAGQEGRRPQFANHLEPVDVTSAVRRGTARIRGWEPTPAERRLATVAEELAELITQAEAGLVAGLPLAMARQPLSSIGGWVARLDDRAAARHHAAGVGPELAAARQIMLELDRWQDTFA